MGGGEGKGLGTELGPWLRKELAPTLSAWGGDVDGEGLGSELEP